MMGWLGAGRGRLALYALGVVAVLAVGVLAVMAGTGALSGADADPAKRAIQPVGAEDTTPEPVAEEAAKTADDTEPEDRADQIARAVQEPEPKRRSPTRNPIRVLLRRPLPRLPPRPCPLTPT